MKIFENKQVLDNETAIRPQTIEEKLNEAEKDYEKNITYSEDDVWKMMGIKHGVSF